MPYGNRNPRPPLFPPACPACGAVKIGEDKKLRAAAYECGGFIEDADEGKGVKDIVGCKKQEEGEREVEGERSVAEEMVRITAELIPFGKESAKRVIGRMDIVNDGTGTVDTGNYYSYISREGSAQGNVRVWKSCIVKGFPRLKMKVWDLIYRVLRETVGSRNERVNEESARRILGWAIQKDGSLSHPTWFINWKPGKETVILNGMYTLEELESIAWWVRERGKEEIRDAAY